MSTAPIDLTNLRDMAMGDDDFVKMMADMFVAQGAAQLDELQKHLVEGASHDWVEIAHSLKGTAAGIGAEAMRALCAQAQDMADTTSAARAEILNHIRAQYDLGVAFLIAQGLIAK